MVDLGMSKETVELDLKWWHFNQNNSGGYFIINDVVSEDVFIQERSAKAARSKAESVFEDYSQYCGCCGERWSYWIDDEDGTDEPQIYGEPISSPEAGGMFHDLATLHYFDGRIEKVKVGGE